MSHIKCSHNGRPIVTKCTLLCDIVTSLNLSVSPDLLNCPALTALWGLGCRWQTARELLLSPDVQQAQSVSSSRGGHTDTWHSTGTTLVQSRYFSDFKSRTWYRDQVQQKYQLTNFWEVRSQTWQTNSFNHKLHSYFIRSELQGQDKGKKIPSCTFFPWKGDA